MKKTLYAAVVMAVLLYGCSKGENGNIFEFGGEGGGSGLRLDRTELTLKCGDTGRITVVSGDAERCIWSSADEFVATVDSEGNVKARHVGTTDIDVVSGTDRASCKVEVSSSNRLFVEPVRDFGASPAQIIAKEDRKLRGESLRTLVFVSSDSRIESVIYVFEEGKMAEAVVSFYRTVSLAEALEEFLGERYELVANTDDRLFTMRGNGVVVAVELQTAYIRVSYTEASGNVSDGM